MNDLNDPRLDRRTILKGALCTAAGFIAFDKVGAALALQRKMKEPFAPMPPLSLEQSLHLAGQNLLAILDPEDHYLPYWQLTVTPEYHAKLQRWWPAHNIGRWLDAMYRLEEATGFEIPKKIDAAMAENARRFFDNPDHISLNPDPAPLNPTTDEPGLIWDLHSIREGMLALHALARWRKSDWAATMGRQMVRSLDAKLRDDGTWDIEKFDACQKRGPAVIHNTQPCDTHGRMIEALLWFYEATGEIEAMRFAERLAQWHFAHTTTADGSINPDCHADHTHSYLGTLRGLLLYGRMTKQREYIDRVAAAYRVNVPKIVHESGYTSHNMVVESFGETTSPGDAAQLALWLCQDGYSEFIDDAERLVRARILPSQIRRTPALRPMTTEQKDGRRDLEQRILGGYGGCHFHPHGAKLAVTDVTSADVHSLVDIYNNVARQDGGTLNVLFHLDHEDPQVKIECRRDDGARLIVTPKADASLTIRIPSWTPRESLRFRAGGRALSTVVSGRFARTGRIPAGTVVEMDYDLPKRSEKETGLGAEYEVFWKGDDVVGVRPNTTVYPFYADPPGAEGPSGAVEPT